jgi:DNA polymerase-1
MIIELDYAQIEVGVAAAEYGDERLIEGYNSGDVYAAMAQVFYVNELSESERTVTPLQFKVLRPELRDNMKTFVLAVLYNIQSPAIASAFSISLKQAELARQRFLNLFPALKLAMETSVACGIYRGYATTVTGLKRHFNKQSNVSSWTRNFLRNTPIQASATIVFKNAVNLIHREYQNNPSILTILTAHDAVVIECPQSEGLGVGQTVKSLMKQSLRTYYPILRGEVEMNDGEPHCWNKKGKANSLRKFLENPEFSFGTNENSKR